MDPQQREVSRERNILALDTATEVLSLALSARDGVFEFEADAGTRHSELLVSGIDLLLKSASVEKADLGAVVCMKGPGSFTGLRIAYAAAKALVLALGVRGAAVPTLDCMAWPHRFWPGLVVPLLDAKQGRFFAAIYRGGVLLSAYLDEGVQALSCRLAALGAGDAPAVLLTGNGAAMALEALSRLEAPAIPAEAFLLDPDFRRGRARGLLNYLAENGMIASGDPSGLPGALERLDAPLYVRQSDAELKRLAAENAALQAGGEAVKATIKVGV